MSESEPDLGDAPAPAASASRVRRRATQRADASANQDELQAELTRWKKRALEAEGQLARHDPDPTLEATRSLPYMLRVTMHPRADRILNYSFTQSRYGFPHIIRTNPATHTYKEWVVEQRQNMTLTLVLRNERGEVGTEKDIVRRGDELEFEAHLIDSRTKRTLSTADLVDDLKKPVTTLFNSPQLDSGGEDRLLGVMTDGDVSFVTMFNFSCQHLKPGIPKGAVRLRVRPTAPALRNDPNLQLETCDFTVKSKITKQQRPTTQEYSEDEDDGAYRTHGSGAVSPI